MLFGVQPHLPVDALIGQEETANETADWLTVHRERLQDAHERARTLVERKAAERMVRQNAKVHWPPVEVGQRVSSSSPSWPE